MAGEGESLWKKLKTDNEDELLRQQDEFLKSKQHPSAKIINTTDSTKRTKNEAHASRKAVFSTPQKSGEIINSVVKEEEMELMIDPVNNIPSLPSNIILGDIIEKKYKAFKFDDSQASLSRETGFPKVFHLSNYTRTDKNQSLFTQHISTIKKEKPPMVSISGYNPVQIQKGEHSDNKEHTSVINQNQLVTEIHEENLKKLAEMSEEKILNEKKSLEETLDPSIVQFFKSKKFHKRPLNVDNTIRHDVLPTNELKMNINMSTDQEIKPSSSNNDNTKMDDSSKQQPLEKMDFESESEREKVDIPNLPEEILEESKQKGWLHMNTPEPEKLKWMSDLSVKNNDEPTSSEWYNARFDFNGLLLPYKDESLTVDKGLHHHGEEPERPGYSLQELLQLCRSATQQQRCTALITLANIMEKTRRGWYDKALHPAPLGALSQKNILLLLRFSLDDTSVAVVTAALQALRAFLCSEADEICLDRLYGLDSLVEPTLAPQLEDKDTSDLKDHELAQLDAVAALLRSDFLLRIRYILREMHPPPVGVTSALEILIRVARHSHETALNISSTPHLLDTIIHNFMPLSTDRLAMLDTINDTYGVPMVKAVKLCRILVTYGKKPVARKLDNFKVIHIILTYISSETGKKDGINLSIESLRLWRLLLHHEVGLDSIVGAQLILLSQLQLLLSNHDIENTSELACEHAAALVAVASHVKMFQPNISTLLAKWSRQLYISKITWGVMKLIAETLSAVDDISVLKSEWILNKHLFSTFRSNSNLLSDCKPATDREPSCLPNLGALMENGELLPIVSLNSYVPLLTTLLNKFYKCGVLEETRAIFEQPFFLKYLQNIEAAEWNFERSWYSRTELFLLTAMAKAASLLKLDSAITQIIWKITIRLVSALPADAGHLVRDLLEIALSNEKMKLGVAMSELAMVNLSSAVNPVKVDLCQDIVSLYNSYIGWNGDWSQAAMPKDWPFLPLVHIYSKCKNNIRLQPKDNHNIVAVLSLTLVLPDLMEKLSPSLRFSRLILVYSCETVYLDNDVSPLLTSVILDLLKRYHTQLDFRTELPGLSSFVDLFTVICEHFCANSYGDDGFAMILLVPIAQRHDTHYRKLLWSEHAGALRYLRLPLEKLVVPLKEYLYPEEEDASLINSYITALVRGVVKESWCPVPYMIALHHSAMYLKRSSNLAVRMRTQVEMLRNKDVADKLLQYEPPRL